MITRAIAGDGDATDPRTWLALYVATLATGALTIACIAGAIAIAEGGMSLATLRQMFAMDGVVTAANSSIAVAAAVLIATDPRAVFVLLVPSAIVFGVYRAYISERQRHEKLEFLYEANRALTRSPEVAEAIEGVLARSLEAFRSEIAEVVLFSADGTALRTTYGPGNERVTMVETDRQAAEELAALIDAETPVVALAPPYEPQRLRAHLEERRIRHAMVAMLPGENRMIGTIMLANRLGIERGYSTEDQRLLELLANNASVALQYDRLEQAVIKLRSLQEQLHHQAYHDPLTDLPNRSLFMERVRDELAERTGTVAVLFIDVDDFKVVNDTLGHAVGDALLVSVAGRLRHCVRPQDVVARLGGDEFAVMLPDVEEPSIELHNVARRILRAFEAPVNAGSELVAVHLSVGITHSARSDDADELIREADLAMYQAKAKGKGRFEFFDPTMAAAMLRRHDLKEELAKAIEREEILVEYQPIVSLRTGRIFAAEALVRWQHPVRGLVAPSEFIPLAEETGLIRELGRHVLTQACRQSRHWRVADVDDPPLRLHVNLVGRAAARSGPDPDRARRPRGNAAGARPARARDHRERAARGRDGERRPVPGAARARRADLARRLRHRLLVAQLPPLAAAGQPQDRQAVRRRAGGPRARGQLHRRDRRPGAQARARRDRRGDRDAGPADGAERARRGARPGLPARPSRAAGARALPARDGVAPGAAADPALGLTPASVRRPCGSRPGT